MLFAPQLVRIRIWASLLLSDISLGVTWIFCRAQPYIPVIKPSEIIQIGILNEEKIEKNFKPEMTYIGDLFMPNFPIYFQNYPYLDRKKSREIGKIHPNMV